MEDWVERRKVTIYFVTPRQKKKYEIVVRCAKVEAWTEQVGQSDRQTARVREHVYEVVKRVQRQVR